jgi:hypothetical protein
LDGIRGNCTLSFSATFCQQLQECFRVLIDKSSELGVPLRNVLDDRFKELRVSLDELTKLLKLRIVSKGIEVCTS